MKPDQPSDSELLTPSEIASLRKDIQESVQLMDELFSDEKRQLIPFPLLADNEI